MLVPIALSLLVYIVCGIVCSFGCVFATIGDEKALKKAEATEAALLFDDTDMFASLHGLEGTSSV